MKPYRTFLLGLTAVAAMSASAAMPDFAAPVALDLPAGSFHPVLSPDGSRLLFSTMDHTGLQCLDIASGQIAIIDTEAAAGFEPVFSIDGSKVLYRTSKIIDKLINRDVRSYSFDNNRRTQLAPMSREVVALKNFDRATYATTDFNRINVTVNGVTNFISPVEDAHSYLWVSMSPDGRRVLFAESFMGVFVCDLDGSNLKSVDPRGAYPCWVDDNTVATLSQTNDGYFVTSSHVTLTDLTTAESKQITTDDILVDEITSAASTRALVYSTFDGQVFILNPKAE